MTLSRLEVIDPDPVNPEKFKLEGSITPHGIEAQDNDENSVKADGAEGSSRLVLGGLNRAISSADDIDNDRTDEAPTDTARSKKKSGAWWFFPCDSHKVVRTVCCTVGKCSQAGRIF